MDTISLFNKKVPINPDNRRDIKYINFSAIGLNFCIYAICTSGGPDLDEFIVVCLSLQLKGSAHCFARIKYPAEVISEKPILKSIEERLINSIFTAQLIKDNIV